MNKIKVRTHSATVCHDSGCSGLLDYYYLFRCDSFKGKLFKSFFISASFIFLLALTSCISFKSEYPQIDFYRLNQEPPNKKNIATVDAILQIRTIGVNEQLDQQNLMAIDDETKIQKYYYNRWITDISSMVTDFVLTRFNVLKAFSGGTIRAGTMLSPDYILEGQLLEMIAHNSSKPEKDQNYVTVTLQISLIKRFQNKTNTELLFTKVYNSKIVRENSLVTTIPPAFSKAFSDVSDLMMNDIQQIISQERSN